MKKLVNGIEVEMTAEEIAQREAEIQEGLIKKQEYENHVLDRENKKASAKQKLQDLGLTVDEIKEAFGI
jgi:phosphoserine phosphatase